MLLLPHFSQDAKAPPDFPCFLPQHILSLSQLWGALINSEQRNKKSGDFLLDFFFKLILAGL